MLFNCHDTICLQRLFVALNWGANRTFTAGCNKCDTKTPNHCMMASTMWPNPTAPPPLPVLLSYPLLIFSQALLSFLSIHFSHSPLFPPASPLNSPFYIQYIFLILALCFLSPSLTPPVLSSYMLSRCTAIMTCFIHVRCVRACVCYPGLHIQCMEVHTHILIK